ncbi:MAG: hypothetical protein IPM21_01445 [Acidobacteria bacterium]|nr:hypothetical protein [Acidobacteriota bacterium]
MLQGLPVRKTYFAFVLALAGLFAFAVLFAEVFEVEFEVVFEVVFEVEFDVVFELVVFDVVFEVMFVLARFAFALVAVLFAGAASPQAIPIAPSAITVERAKTFFISCKISCLLKRLSILFLN